jgi:hypothetical protein
MRRRVAKAAAGTTNPGGEIGAQDATPAAEARGADEKSTAGVGASVPASTEDSGA